MIEIKCDKCTIRIYNADDINLENFKKATEVFLKKAERQRKESTK